MLGGAYVNQPSGIHNEDNKRIYSAMGEIAIELTDSADGNIE